MLTENFVEELKRKVNILDVVSSSVNLSHKGRYYVGLCPFHAEKTASFNVYPESNSFYCFGCGEGGDIITFIEKTRNFGYVESIKMLASMAGISLDLDDESLEKDKKIINEKRKILEINRAAAKFFYRTLWNGSKESFFALEHLKNRNFSKKTLITFGIGYAPENRTQLVKYLKENGYPGKEIVDANLAYIKNGMLIARFYSRVMFPIIDKKGNVIAFGGRTLKEGPKYLNTADTLVFKKSMNLFCLNFVKKEKPDSVILVEGYMDAIALHQNGFKNTLATLGTALTEYQARIISTLVSEVIICYDSDPAGEKATLKATKLLRKEGLKVKILNVPSGKDPEEFLRIAGKNADIKFKNILNESKNDVEYKLIKVYNKINNQTSEGKVAYLEQAAKILSLVNNKLEREVYASKICRVMEVNKITFLELINKELKKVKKKQKCNQFKVASEHLGYEGSYSATVSVKTNTLAVKAWLSLCAFIINNPENANNIFLKLPVEGLFFDDFSNRIYTLIYEELKNNGNVSYSSICRKLNENETREFSKYLALEALKNSTLKDANNYIKIILCEKERLSIVNSGEEALGKKIVTYVSKLRQLKS